MQALGVNDDTKASIRQQVVGSRSTPRGAAPPLPHGRQLRESTDSLRPGRVISPPAPRPAGPSLRERLVANFQHMAAPPERASRAVARAARPAAPAVSFRPSASNHIRKLLAPFV